MSESYDFFLTVENFYFLGYKLDWIKMVMSHVVLQQLMRCFKWCISILYVPSVHKEYCFRWTTSWKQLSLMNIGYSKCVIITYCDYIMKSIPSNLPLLREFFFPRPLSLTSHLVITFIFDVFICVMFYSLNVHRNSPFKIKSNMKNYLNLSMKFKTSIEKW